MGHPSIVANAVADNVRAVRRRIDAARTRAGRTAPEEDVRLLAAAKYADDATVRALLAAGVRDLAENRIAGLAARQQELADAADVTWHFIGALQSRKAAEVAARVAMLHSLSTPSGARKLEAAAAAGLALPQVLVQVNVAGDEAKEGVSPEHLPSFLEDLPPAIAVDGLMTMPPLARQPEDSRASFRCLRELRDSMQAEFGSRHPLAYLSMGTSQDFEVAVEEGSTHVRLGRVLYGVQE